MMDLLRETLINSPFFGLAFSFALWCFGRIVEQKTGFILCNHLLIAFVTGICLLIIFDIPYDTYYQSAAPIGYMLTPATALLALNIYRQRAILKQYFLPVLVACFAGCLTSILLVLLLCKVMMVDATLANSILPKSVTTAIAIGIAETRGGVGGLAAAGVMMAGMTGGIFVPLFEKVFKVNNPVAEGLAIGACSHAMGTTTAMRIGPVQGAMSSIALCICGIMTSIIVLFV